MRLGVFIRTGLLLAVASLPVPASAQPAAKTAITIDASTPGPVISRDIFGQFAEHLGEGIYGGVWVGPDSKIPNLRGIRSDVVAALRAIKVPNVRWPGGCHADRYDWRDGIGAAPARKSRISMWGNVIDPNSFGTHEFMDFVEQIGAEAYVSVNVGSGTPQQAADWLEYMTADQPTTLAKERIANGRAKPWRIKFLGLGNELWGCGGAMSAEHNAEETKRFAVFAKSHHPDQAANFTKAAAFPMQKIAVGRELGHADYIEPLLKDWTKRAAYAWNIDAISLHYYTGDPQPMMSPSSDFGEKEYAAILKKTLKMDDMIVEHKVLMDRYDPEKKLGLAIDEWGAWLRPQSQNFLFLCQQNSMRDAVLTALNFNIFIRHADRVRIANIAQMVNVIQSVILTDGAKMLLTPTYHVHKMYVPFQGAQLIPVSFAPGAYRFGDISLPQIDGIAAKASDGSVWLALTNVDPNQAVGLNVNVQGLAVKSASGEVLTAPKVDSINTFEAPDAVSTKPVRFGSESGELVLKLPPKSVTVLRLETAVTQTTLR